MDGSTGHKGNFLVALFSAEKNGLDPTGEWQGHACLAFFQKKKYGEADLDALSIIQGCQL